MSVDEKQKKSMADIMTALSSATDGNVTNPLTGQKKSDETLNNIINAFRSSTDELIVESVDPEFNAAIETERVPDGVRMGSWKITVREEANGKFYDISHKTGGAIANDIRLYEAAHGIVKALDAGQTFTSPLIRSILEFENDYSKALSDALMFTHRVRVTEGVQKNVAEARLSEVKRRAVAARKAISSLLS